MKNLSIKVGVALACLAMTTQLYANVSCDIAVSTKAKEIATREGLKDKATSELVALVEKDPDLIKYLSDVNFINYVKAVAQGKDHRELAPFLYQIWKNESLRDVNLSNINGGKTPNDKVGVIKLAQIFMEANAIDPKTVPGRFKYNMEKFVLQLKKLPYTLKKLKTMMNAEMHPNVLDANVWAFKGFLDYKIRDAGLRPWDAVIGSMDAVRLSDVENVSPMTVAAIQMMANAIEIPIGPYSNNSGETLRAVSPHATRFMGRTDEQEAYFMAQIAKMRDEALAAGKPFKEPIHCEASWCREENRHAGTLRNSATGVVGFPMKEDTQFSSYPGLDPLKIENALFHLFSRNSTEWNAGSGYFLVGGHATGALAGHIGNVRRDELKHQSIFGGLYKYLLGDTYGKRLTEMSKKLIHEIGEKGSSTSLYGDVLNKEPLSLIEIIYIHIRYEMNIRKFFATLPLKSLRKIYDTQINLTPIPELPMSADKQKAIEQLSAREASLRKALARWPKAQREAYEAMEAFEIRLNSNITRLIKEKFITFKGAEDYGSFATAEMGLKIDRLEVSDLADYGMGNLSPKEMALLKRSLKETLRDYQIMNNTMVRNMGLSVELVDALHGFELVKDAAYEAVPKAK